MKGNQRQPERPATLRGRAEKRMSHRQPPDGKRSEMEDPARLIHELQVHEIELEMQNEELQESRAQLEALRAAEGWQARVQSEALLAQYTDLYDSAPVGYFSLGLDSEIRRANLTGARLLGVERGSLVNHRFDQFVAEADRPRFDDFLKRIIHGRTAAGCELMLPCEGSQPLVVRVEGTRSTDGQECRAVVLDITERRMAEARVRQQAALLDTANDAIYVQSLDQRVRYWNQGAERVYSWLSSEALGRKITELTQPGHEGFESAIAAVLKEGSWSGELTTKSRSGTPVTVFCRWTVLRNPLGQTSEILAINTDITVRKQLEVEIRQAQKMESVGRLAGGIAHDFNNMLTLINGTVDILLRELPARSPLRTDLEEIRNAGDRAASLTRQLLVFSRKHVTKLEVLNLSLHLAGLKGMLRRLIGENISVVFQLAEELGHVLVDRTQIEQVVMNLVINARDAMPGGGRLTIETRDVHLDEMFAAEHPTSQTGPHVMLTVSDTGTGMDAVTLERVFEPFFTTKEQGKGTGLGLSTAYGIVTQAGGSIWAQSAPGQGSTFRICLPRVDAAADSPVIPAAAEMRGGTETILVVEDEAGVRRLAQRILESAGYTVLTAGSGAEALEVLERYEGVVHLVFTDLVMPGGMTGRDLAVHERLVKLKSRILITSGFVDKALLHDWPLGARGHFVAKPYTATDLMRSVRAVLDT